MQIQKSNVIQRVSSSSCLLVSDSWKPKEHPCMYSEHQENLENELAKNLLT